MSIPNFSGDASLYETTVGYRTTETNRSSQGGVMLAASGIDALCRCGGEVVSYTCPTGGTCWTVKCYECTPKKSWWEEWLRGLSWDPLGGKGGLGM